MAKKDETAEDKGVELQSKQIWESGPKENPFEAPVKVLVSDVKKNSKGVPWVKFSRWLPNVGNTPVEYATEKEFRQAYPVYISPEL